MGIDLSLKNIGITILTEAGLVIRTLTIKTEIEPKASSAQKTERLIYIANEIVGRIKEFRVKHIGIEDYAFNARYHAHQLGEIGGTIKTQVRLACSIYVSPVAIQASRKHVLGYGGSFGSKTDGKKNITKVVRDGYGVDVANDHEADSFVVARYTFDTAVAEEKEARELWEKRGT
jgi:Holliday junction resolvasome RuvABC endonuclease subunit